MSLVHDRFTEVEEGQQHLVTIGGSGAVVRQVRIIWQRAGVTPWERLWQTLRQSCEKEWAMKFPQYAVSKWIGHSITVSGRHYANNVPDELFAKAAGMSDEGNSTAQRHAQQKVHEQSRNNQKHKTNQKSQERARKDLIERTPFIAKYSDESNPNNCTDERVTVSRGTCFLALRF